jgi:neutral trehalase
MATASAKVVVWSNNLLHLTNINGNFISSIPVWGTISNANYNFTGYNVTSQQPVNLQKLLLLLIDEQQCQLSLYIYHHNYRVY